MEKKKEGVVLHDLITVKNVGTSCINVCYMHRDIFLYDEYECVHYEKENDRHV